MTKYALLAAVMMLPPVVQAQPPMDVLVKHWKASGDLTLEVAKAMPADGYTFKPNDEEMDYGRLMVHIGLANNNAFAIISGKDNPTPKSIIATYVDPKGTFKKDEVVKFLTDSFAFGTETLQSASPERLHMMLGPENAKIEGFE